MDDTEGGSAERASARSPEQLFVQLRAELPQLASQFVSRVRGSVKGYEAGALVPEEDLYRTAIRSMDVLLESLCEGEATDSLVEQAESLGRRRARQQVPAESLTMAMQADFGRF